MNSRDLNVIFLSLFLGTFGAMAQENNQNGSGSQQIVNKVINYSDKPLNIDGQVTETEPATDSELNFINNELKKQKTQIYLNKEKSKGYKNLQNTTETLVGATEDYVTERKSSEAKIKEYNKQIKCLLDENAGDPDCVADKPVIAPAPRVIEQRVKVVQAAPTQVSVKKAPQTEEFSFVDSLKVLGDVGARNYSNGQHFRNLESTPSFGLKVESELNRKVSIGLGLSYHKVKFLNDQFSNSHDVYGYGAYNNGYNQPYYNNNYSQFFGNGRSIKMDSIGAELYGKFYLLSNTRLRPYVGVGTNLNRLNLAYDDSYAENFDYQNDTYFFGGENHTTWALGANLKGGVEFSFTRNIGFFVEGSYTKGLTSFGGSNLRDFYGDEAILRELSVDFARSNAFGVNAGLSITF